MHKNERITKYLWLNEHKTSHRGMNLMQNKKKHWVTNVRREERPQSDQGVQNKSVEN